MSFRGRIVWKTGCRGSLEPRRPVAEPNLLGRVNPMFRRNVSIIAKAVTVMLTLICLSRATSSEVNNCCSVDRQCTTDEEWTAGYYAFQNNQCAAPADSQQQTMSTSQPQPASTASEDIDNCCFVDRQCSTDEEWINGYNAYQSGQCAAPAQQQSQARQAQQSPSQVNNCCFSGWQCDTDEEWTSGYWAFQHDHCASQSHWETQVRNRQQQRGLNAPKPNGWGGWCPPDCVRKPIGVEYDEDERKYTYYYESPDRSGLVDQIEIWHHTWEEFCELVEDEHPSC